MGPSKTEGARPEDETGLDSAFEAAFMAHYGRVYSLLIRLVGEHGRAEELASDVFRRLYNQPGSAPLWENAAAWLYRTATNAGLDFLRASARRRRYESDAGRYLQAATPGGSSPLDSVLRDEQRRQVQAVLGAMRPAQAQILLMRASGCSYKELAEALQIAATGVGTALSRAEAEFRKRYIKLAGHKEVL